MPERNPRIGKSTQLGVGDSVRLGKWQVLNKGPAAIRVLVTHDDDNEPVFVTSGPRGKRIIEAVYDAMPPIGHSVEVPRSWVQDSPRRLDNEPSDGSNT